MSDKQQGVNDMAVAIAGAEFQAGKLMRTIGKLPEALEKFRTECDLHSMLVAEASAKVGGAMAAAGLAFKALYEAHEELSEVLEKCQLPQPGPVPLGGGGGGKAAGEYGP